MDCWGPSTASITGRQVQLEWGLKVTFKSVGTAANMSNRSNSIGAIDNAAQPTRLARTKENPSDPACISMHECCVCQPRPSIVYMMANEVIFLLATCLVRDAIHLTC